MMSREQQVSTTVREAAGTLRAALSSIAEEIAAEVAAGGNGDACYDRVKSAVDECVATLRALGLDGLANQIPSSELWNVAGDVLQRGWLQTQARTKPRGYAGDHEMLARIYEHSLCDDPLGRQFDRYFQEEAAPQAVCNRMHMLRDWIVAACAGLARPWKVAVVGSALGLEVRDALISLHARARQHVQVTLLDLDPAALDFARQRLMPLLSPERLQMVSGNLFRLPSRAGLAKPLAQSDLLVCPGLFDYLSDSDAVAMLGAFRAALKPGGVAHVFQFAPHNPTRTYMEWLGNWYLTYRVADDLRRLAEAAGVPPEGISLGSEPLGVDLLLSIEGVRS